MKLLVALILCAVTVFTVFADFDAGMSKLQAGDYRGAMADFRAVIKENPTHMPSYAHLAVALFRTGQFKHVSEAFPILIREGKIDLNSRQYRREAFLILKQIGLSCLQIGASKRAEVALTIANKLAADDHEVLGGLGLAYLRTGKFWQAELFFQSALGLDAQNTVYLNYLGVVNLELKKPREALAFFEQALRIDPQYANGWANLWRTRAALSLPAYQGWRHFGYFSDASAEEKESMRAAQAEHAERQRRQAEEQARLRQAAEQRRLEEARRAEALRRQREEAARLAGTNTAPRPPATNARPPLKPATNARPPVRPVTNARPPVERTDPPAGGAGTNQ